MKKVIACLIIFLFTGAARSQGVSVYIGTQQWMQKNLEVAFYRNGEPIVHAQSTEAWIAAGNAGIGAWCYYSTPSDPTGTTHGLVYGKLYNWYAVAGIYDAASLANPALRTQLAPEGWHIPTNAEWNILVKCIDPFANITCSSCNPCPGCTFPYPTGPRTPTCPTCIPCNSCSTPLSPCFLCIPSETVGDAMKEPGIAHWLAPDRTAPGATPTEATNTSGFTGLPGGFCNSIGVFNTVDGSQGLWWSSTETETPFAWYHTLTFNTSHFNRNSLPKNFGFSVRCLMTPEVFLPTVVIGTQQWMQKNLEVAFYRNGEEIPQATTNAEWTNARRGAWCYYNNDPSTGYTYGKLYNWYAVNDPRGLAPAGWHIPTDAEWTTLENSLGGSSVAGGKMKEPGTAHWAGTNTGVDNSSGWAGLPGGYRRYDNGTFYFVNAFGLWWSSTENETTNAWLYRYLYYFGRTIYSGLSDNRKNGFSVRCLRD
jgi:uncharacterized protein (TIGR02145 family)